jgi:hypothetical protein
MEYRSIGGTIVRKLLAVGPLVTVTAAAMLSLGVAAPAQAASGWNAEVQCYKIRISDNTTHAPVEGHGWGKTQAAAWAAAKKNANDLMPKGYRAKHCDKKRIKKA